MLESDGHPIESNRRIVRPGYVANRVPGKISPNASREKLSEISQICESFFDSVCDDDVRIFSTIND